MNAKEAAAEWQRLNAARTPGPIKAVAKFDEHEWCFYVGFDPEPGPVDAKAIAHAVNLR